MDNIYCEHIDEAYQLLHDGILALAKAEQHGLRIDVEYIENKNKEIDNRIKELEGTIYKSKFYKDWQRSQKTTVNIYSPKQMGDYLYKHLNLSVGKSTKSGAGSTDEETLAKLNIFELNTFLEIKKLQKIKTTYLSGFMREQVNGIIHPFFNLHLVQTYRSCISKGTKILTICNGVDNLEGTPIENVKVGDYVHCFSNDLKPSIRKVLWAGKTGFKKVIRIHWSSSGGGKGHLDVTPEHRIRLIDGTYCEAQHLVGDFRKLSDSNRVGKIRALSCCRVKDQMYYTGHLTNGGGILEHRLVYEELIGNLPEEKIIHHKDGNHLKNIPTNLRKLSRQFHGKIHSLNVSEEIKQKRINVLNENRHKIIYKRGEEAHNSLNLSKFQCLRYLAACKGKIVNVQFDFGTFKKYCEQYNISSFNIRKRYSTNGTYIWKSFLEKTAYLGRTKVSKLIGGCNYYTLLELYSYYGIDPKRKWGNQFGEFVPGNHTITKIEQLGTFVDVYDLEVEEYNNFFANEICVHNSSDRPNFQNIPKRDKEAMQIVRKAIFPRKGRQLLELDYSQLEVRIAACYHLDPMMLDYIETGHDMHLDIAKQIFCIDQYDGEAHGVLRQASKNGFVFPQFYGDYYVNNAKGIANDWCKLPEGKWKSGMGVQVGNEHVSDLLIRGGIKEYGVIKRTPYGSEATGFLKHLQDIETDFWTERFPVYDQWKEQWWKEYQSKGYFISKTGFLYKGVMSRNDVINYPVQGSAFHVMLWSLIKATEVLKEKGLRTKIVGQIHDAIVLDVVPSELPEVIKIMKRIMERDVRKHWDWIVTPLQIEAELCPVDGSWADKQKFKI